MIINKDKRFLQVIRVLLSPEISNSMTPKMIIPLRRYKTRGKQASINKIHQNKLLKKYNPNKYTCARRHARTSSQTLS